jgi:hypothetical protein
VTRTRKSLGLSCEEVTRCDLLALADRLRSADADFRRADAVIESVAALLTVLNELALAG